MLGAKAGGLDIVWQGFSFLRDGSSKSLGSLDILIACGNTQFSPPQELLGPLKLFLKFDNIKEYDL